MTRTFGLCLALLVAIFILPMPAAAQGVDDPTGASAAIDTAYACIKDEANAYDDAYAYGYVTRIRNCMRDMIISTTLLMLQGFSDFMSPIMLVATTLAVMFFGMRLMLGEKQVLQSGTPLLFKMLFVFLFSYNLAGLGEAMFYIMQDFSTWVSGGCDPFGLLDMFIHRLLGIGPGILLSQGLLGLLGAAVFSANTGLFIFLTGLMAVVSLFFIIFRIVYMYLTAMVVMALMIILSPAAVPMLLFKATREYFDKWFRVVLTAMLTPMLIFAFLTHFLGFFNYQINSVFAALGAYRIDNPVPIPGCTGDQTIEVYANPDMSAFQKTDMPAGSWIMPTDPTLSKQIADETDKDPKKATAPVQSYINPRMQTSTDVNSKTTPSVDFGTQGALLIQQLGFAFVLMWLYMMIVKNILVLLPGMASKIAGSGVDLSHTMQAGNIEQKVDGMKDKAMGKLQSAGGGGAGVAADKDKTSGGGDDSSRRRRAMT